jgi:hypothetical protein
MTTQTTFGDSSFDHRGVEIPAFLQPFLGCEFVPFLETKEVNVARVSTDSLSSSSHCSSLTHETSKDGAAVLSAPFSSTFDSDDTGISKTRKLDSTRLERVDLQSQQQKRENVLDEAIVTHESLQPELNYMINERDSEKATILAKLETKTRELEEFTTSYCELESHSQYLESQIENEQRQNKALTLDLEKETEHAKETKQEMECIFKARDIALAELSTMKIQLTENTNAISFIEKWHALETEAVRTDLTNRPCGIRFASH